MRWPNARSRMTGDISTKMEQVRFWPIPDLRQLRVTCLPGGEAYAGIRRNDVGWLAQIFTSGLPRQARLLMGGADILIKFPWDVYNMKVTGSLRGQ